MRYFIPALSSLLLFPSADARAQQQIANGGFEDWSPVTLYEEIGEWTSSNSQLPTEPAITKVPGHAGNWAAHLETGDFGGSPVPAYILHGEVVNGNIVGGLPFTTAIDTIRGWYRYDLQPGDSAAFLVGIWSTGVLAVFDILTVGGSQPAWTAFSLPVNQGVPIAPDSVVIAVASSNPYALGAAAGSWIEVDGVALTSFIEPTPQPIPNGDMETWYDVQIEGADDWSSFDPYLAAIGLTSLTKSTQSYSGMFAARIETIDVGGDTIPGLLTNGTISPFGVTGGVAYTDTPIALKGFIDRAPVGQDTSAIYAVFMQGGAPIGSAYTIFTGAGIGWESFNLPVFLLGTPDSLNITFFAGAVPGSAITLDGLEFEFLPTGIAEHRADSPGIFPNPVDATSTIVLNGTTLTKSQWSIIDARGGRVGDGSFSGASQELLHLSTSALPPGAYWLRVELDGACKSLPFIKR